MAGRGSIRQRGENRWQLRAYVADGRSATETVRGTRADAERRLRKLLDEVDEGSHRGPDPTLSRFLDDWMKARAYAWSPSTVDMTRTHIECYLKPKLGAVRLSRIDPSKIDVFYGELLRGGVKGRPLSPAYVRRIHGTLHLALEQAANWSIIPRNPASRATPPVAVRHDLVPPDAEEIRLLVAEAAAVNPLLAVFIRLAAAVGPRRGEIAGLRRSDLDLEAGAIVFRRTVVRSGGSELVVKPGTKTGSARRVALDPATAAVLVNHLDWLGKRAAQAGVVLAKDPWLFSYHPRADEPPRPDSFTQAFNRLRDRLGLRVRLHDLRHAHATYLITAGVDPRTVASRLGHSSPRTTLDIYSHFMPSADRAAAEKISGMFEEEPGAGGASRSDGPPPGG